MSGSAQQRLHRSVLEDAGYICYVCRLPGADTVDHVIAISDGGSKGSRSNLGAIHQDPCHKEKTDQENARRRARRASQRNA